MQNQINTLKNVFVEHREKVSDKWSAYVAEYDRLFQVYRDQPIRLLEIGVQNGGSLEIWGKFFTNAEKLVGCDINPDCAQLQFDDPKIVIVAANANTDEAQQRILTHSSSFDLIIDDGSHQSGDIVHSFARYFDYLSDGGLYVAEDLHCSYWQEFEGGIFHPFSSMAFLKRLADTINHEHWGIDRTRCDLLRSFTRKFDTTLNELTLAHIHSIEFLNSMCVIKKAAPDDNILGTRFIAGTNALVCKDILQARGTSRTPPDQNTNKWSTRDLPIEEELVVRIQEVDSLNHALSARDEEITKLSQAHAERERELQERLLAAQQELQNIEQSWVDRAAVQERQLLQEKAVLQSQIDALRQALQASEQEKLQQRMASTEQERAASQAHAERERELHEMLLAAQAEFSRCEQEWAARSTSQKDELLAMQRDSTDLQSQMQEQIRAAEQASHQWQLARNALQGEINAIEASLTWRITAPLRKLGHMVFLR
jgi:hypothetical protein